VLISSGERPAGLSVGAYTAIGLLTGALVGVGGSGVFPVVAGIVGVAVAAMTGACVGLFVAAFPVGAGVAGTTVGAAVGVSVTLFDGSGVGDTVGAGVAGTTVGAAVGVSVTPFEGSGVGDTVGAGVAIGAGVASTILVTNVGAFVPF
jgi:hypothetical protein